MKIMYCDRCGVEHREGVKGGRVVRVTWEPLQRTMDLCGSCRVELQRALDAFEQGWPQSTASVERAPNPQPPLPPQAAEGEGPEPAPSAAPSKADGESWDAYAHRLEHRIRAQRDLLEHLNSLKREWADRHDRRRIVRMERALGRMTENWQREREARVSLVEKVKALEGTL